MLQIMLGNSCSFGNSSVDVKLATHIVSHLNDGYNDVELIYKSVQFDVYSTSIV